MPFAEIADSPLAGGPARIHYRERGGGVPLVFLHSGWGYEPFPLGAAWGDDDGLRVLAPDRSGYGQSTRPARFDEHFHHYAAAETLAFLDALGIQRAVFWGHSDGAVIAALIGLQASSRCRGVILEAFHFARGKPGSRDFFEAGIGRPEFVGSRMAAVLAGAHGEPYWRELLGAHARAWLAIGTRGGDLYDGQLDSLRVPTLVLHGGADPRTEPEDLDAVRHTLPHAAFHMISGGGHSPHSEAACEQECARVVRAFIAGLPMTAPE